MELRPGFLRRGLLISTIFCALAQWATWSPPAAAQGGSPGAAQTSTPSGMSDREKAIATFRAVLNDPKQTEYMRMRAASSAINQGFRELKPDLERVAAEDPSPKVRRAAAVTLKAWQEEDARAAERKTTGDEIRRQAAMTPEERERKRHEQEKVGVESKRDEILQKLQSEKADDRRLVLAWSDTWAKHLPETIPVLKKMIRSDKDERVRMYALIAVASAEPEGPEKLSFLRSCLGRENPFSVRQAAAFEVCERGEKEGLDVLIEQLSFDDVHFQAYRMKTLRGTAMKGDIGPPPRLLTKAESRNAALSEEEKREIREGAATWQKWWKEARPTFVMPVLRAKAASSRPTTGPGR